MIPTIEAADMWQTTDLDELIAVELFGWQWWSWFGRPTHSHPEYPKECRVRQLLSAKSLSSERWQAYLAEKDGAIANGDEPLSYAYCSSCGPECVPHFSGNLNDVRSVEKELRKRGLMTKYQEALVEVCRGAKRAMSASAKSRCIAALLAIKSPSIKAVEA